MKFLNNQKQNNVLDEADLIPIREEVFDVTPKQRKFIDDIVGQKLIEHEIEISEYISNLQLEMTRQFLIQKEEILACMKSKIKSDLERYLD